MFEAYSVAIRLRLVDSVSAGLIGLAGQFTAFNKHVNSSSANLKALEGQLQRIKMMGILGGAAFGVGAVGLMALSAPLKAAREYELAFTRFKTLNLGDVVNREADKFARGADLMGVSATQLMKTMAESVGIFGGWQDAKAFAPRIAELNTANSAIFHGKIGEIDEGSTRALVKFLDRRGLTKDGAGFNRGLDLAERLVTGSGGFIQFRDLGNFSQQAGTAFRALSDTGLTNLSLLMQEQGGMRAGTALMSLYQNLVAGRTPKKTMALLQEFGLGHMGEIVTGTVGGKKSTSTVLKDVKDSALLQADPATWFRTIFLPALAAHGITSESGILKATNDLISNRTASNQASIMTTQLLQIARDAKLARDSMGVNQVLGAFRNDPNSKVADLQAKYTNLLIELGESALPIATRAVSGLITVIKSATGFAHNFPGVTKALVVGFTALSALMVAGGAATLITAGFRALGLALVVSRGIGLGAQLMQVAGGLGSLSATAGIFLGRLGLVGAAGGVGYLIGDTINKAGPNGDLGGWLAGKLAEVIHPYKANQVTHVHMHLDGKKIATVVTKHQAKALSGPQTGPSAFDPRMNVIPAGGY